MPDIPNGRVLSLDCTQYPLRVLWLSNAVHFQKLQVSLFAVLAQMFLLEFIAKFRADSLSFDKDLRFVSPVSLLPWHFLHLYSFVKHVLVHTESYKLHFQLTGILQDLHVYFC